jgi:hypothetical protein
MSLAKCDVCGLAGEFHPAPVPAARAAELGRAIVHCRRCRQFLCVRHAERLPEVPHLTCPFDPGVRLGDAAAEDTRHD